MNLRLIIVIIFLTLLNGNAFSQNIIIQDENYLYQQYNIYEYQLNYEDIKGSPYLNDSLIWGVVNFINGDSVSQYLRFNVYEGTIEYLDNNNLLIINNIQQIDNVLIDNDKIVYRLYDSGSRSGLFIEKVKGKFSFYEKPVVEFEKAKPAIDSYHEPTPEAFVRKAPLWYFSTNNGPLIHFIPNKSGLKEIFGEDYDTIDKYRKREKLKYGREEDLVALFEYFNTLQQDL